MIDVAALFVDPYGIYSKTPGVTCYGLPQKDARDYKGICPVVAHPPCQLWGNFARINYLLHGGDHNKPGNDGGCFAFALASVKQWGGVLEHPANTKAWPAHGLLRPKFHQWIQSSDGYWVTEVWQSAYGHRARKRTWLLYSGNQRPLPCNWAKVPGVAVVGNDHKTQKVLPRLGKKEASATPPLFADYLVRLARHAL